MRNKLGRPIVGLISIILVSFSLVIFSTTQSNELTNTTRETNTFFCPNPPNYNTSLLLVSNSNKPVTFSLTGFLKQGGEVSFSQTIMTAGLFSINLNEKGFSNSAGLKVTANSSHVTVAVQFSKGGNNSAMGCLSSTSRYWVLPDFMTNQGANSVLNIINPSAEDAIVNVSQSGPNGVVAEQALSGLDVSPYSYLSINLNNYFPDQNLFSIGVSSMSGSARIYAYGILYSSNYIVGENGSLLLGAKTGFTLAQLPSFTGSVFLYSTSDATLNLSSSIAGSSGQAFIKQAISAELALSLPLDQVGLEPTSNSPFSIEANANSENNYSFAAAISNFGSGPSVGSMCFISAEIARNNALLPGLLPSVNSVNFLYVANDSNTKGEVIVNFWHPGNKVGIVESSKYTVLPRDIISVPINESAPTAIAITSSTPIYATSLWSFATGGLGCFN